MRNLLIAAALLTLSTAAVSADAAAKGKPGATPYAAALVEKDRPKADVDRDAARKPAEMLAFIGVKRGDVIADYLAGSGYFTRIFAGAVGPGGHVFAQEPDEVARFPGVAKAIVDLKAYASSHPNVSVGSGPAVEQLKFPRPLSVFWISQNYHDLKDKFMGPVDTAVFNKAVYKALKPGGIYVVLDHVALPNTPDDTEKLHRIDPAVVRREVEAAGFHFVGASEVLRNPYDPHTANVFDKSIRGHTDQFIFKFRKPVK